MKEIGQVVKVSGQNIKVRLKRKSACGSCNMCGFKSGDMHVDISTENKVGAKLGDSVEMEMEASTVLFSATIVYLLPLATGLLGFFVARVANQTEVVQFCGLMAGVAVGFLAIFGIDKKVKKTKFNPVCTRIVQGNQEKI